jgi:hypothetical protein
MAVTVNAVLTNAVVAADSVAANAVMANAIVATKSRRRSHGGGSRKTRHNNKLALEIQAAATQQQACVRDPGRGDKSEVVTR